MADAAAASEVVLNFPPNLGVLECMPSTGSEVRDRCREVIVKSLKKGVSQGRSICCKPYVCVIHAVYYLPLLLACLCTSCSVH